MSANEKQVAGAHYRSEYQHWDFVVEALSNRYLEGCATKYIARWRKKNGLQDLKKARHYVEKVLEQFTLNLYREMSHVAPQRTLALTHTFVEANGVLDKEARILTLLAMWSGRADLERALQLIDELIDSVPDELRAGVKSYNVPGFAFEGISNGLVHWQCAQCQAHIVSREYENGNYDTPQCAHDGNRFRLPE